MNAATGSRMTHSLAKLRDELTRDVARLRDRITRFGTQFAEAPSYWLGRADSVFEAAAELQVKAELLDVAQRDYAIEKGDAVVAELRDYALKTVLRMSRENGRSTSQTHNLMRDAELAAWSRLLDFGGVLFMAEGK